MNYYFIYDTFKFQNIMMNISKIFLMQMIVNVLEIQNYIINKDISY